MYRAAPSQEIWSSGPGIFESLFRYRYAVVACTAAAVVAAFFGSQLLPTMYSSTATVVMSFGDLGVDDIDRRVRQEANALTSRAVLTEVQRELDARITTEALEDAIDVEADPVVGLLEVTATSAAPETAATIANTVVNVYQQLAAEASSQQVEAAREALNVRGTEIRERITQLQRGPDSRTAARRQEIASLQAQLTALETRISDVMASSALSGSNIKAVESAIEPVEPSAPKPLRNAALGGMLGFILAVAVAYWRAGVADRAKFDITNSLDAPLLARIPRFGQLYGGEGDPLVDFHAAEAYQFLLSGVEYVLSQTNAKSILVTSALPGDGKSLTSLHLGMALAIQGRKVMLVDSDIRAGGLTSLLRAENAPGLDALAQGESVSKVIRKYRVSQTVQLPLVPAGPPPRQATGLLASHRYRRAIARIIDENELTIIDSAPLLAVADASALATEVDGIVLVVDAQTSQDDVLKLRQRLRLIPTPLLGVVLNRVVERQPTPYGEGAQPQQAPSPQGRLGRVLRRRAPTTT